MRTSIALAVAALALGCAHRPAAPDLRCAKPYEPLEVETDVAPRRLMEAATEVMGAQGYRDIFRSADGTRVLGSSAERDGMRDRAKVEVLEGRFRVDLRTELREGVADWIRSDEVCAGYSYSREGELAQAIVRSARASGATAFR